MTRVPATPDATEAQDAAKQELSQPIYQEKPSLLARVWEWLHTHLNPAEIVPGAPAWLSYCVVGFATLLLLIALYIALRHASFARSARRKSMRLFDDQRDSSSLTRAADEAAASGDWTVAVVERFRAIIRSLDERGLITDYPGMTAHEAATVAAQPLPTLRQALGEAAGLFDAVRYGDIVSTSAQDEWMRQFAQRVAQEEPTPQPPSSQQPTMMGVHR